MRSIVNPFKLFNLIKIKLQHGHNALSTLLYCAGEKKFKLDEFLPIFSQVKKDKDMGTYEDFMECLKLYDKNGDGTMIGAELYHILVSLGKTFLH